MGDHERWWWQPKGRDPKKTRQQKKEVREAKKKAEKQKSKSNISTTTTKKINPLTTSNPYRGMPADYDIEVIEPIEIPVDDDYTTTSDDARMHDKKPNEVEESMEVGDESDEDTE